MSEYIGYEEESPFPIIDGSHPKYAVLTDEEIVRCRDCKKSLDDGTKCTEWAREWTFAEVEPNGYCAWGEKL